MPDKSAPRRQQFLTAAVEIGFIVFLFYANLLMGEFTRSNGVGRTLAFAMRDICTLSNFAIGFTAACLGHGIFEFLRRRV